GNGGGGNNSGQVTLINNLPPLATPDNRNDPPVAQDDVFTVSNSTSVFSVGVNDNEPSPGRRNILNNDSDCLDTTANRMVQGQQCSSIDDVRDGPDTNGDGVTAAVRNQVRTDMGATISINSNGSFTYDPRTLYDDQLCNATQITDTYVYQIVDGRDAVSSARISFNVTINGEPNNRPERENRNIVLHTVDDPSQTSVGGGVTDFDQLFTDTDGDSLTYSLDRVQGYTDSLFTINGGSWNFNIPPSAIDAPVGTVTDIRINIEADDGKSRCNEQDNRFVIRVLGSGDPPTPTPLPTSPPPDNGSIGGGGQNTG
ncbi:MAG: VCBS domain-containing protein, partial [Chloroflexota bacterium]